MNVRAQMKGQMLIGGEMVAGQSNNWIESVNPANEERLGEFVAGDAADVNRAVAAAEKAQPAWAALDIKERGKYLKTMAKRIRERGEELLHTEVLDPGMELWWVGPTGWWAPQEWLADLFRRGKRRSARGRKVRFLGVVPDRRLCQLYRQAAFTIYPSLYEGFGFPVLDSLLHDTPVLSSFHSSLQEFAGPGVFYFDPYDPASVDAAYRQLRAAPAVRVDHSGLRHRFSWDALAQTVLSLCA